MKYLNLASRVFNTPLLVESSYLATFVSAFVGQDPQITLSQINMPDGSGLTPEQALSGAPNRARSVGYQNMNGVAVIPVSGTLVNKGSYLPSASGMQGYNGILTMLSEALDDTNVDSVLFDIDSSGGEVAGCFDLCRLIAASRDEKPIAAFVGEQATSAAYAIASSASTVYVPQTGILGSIGVVVAHQDFSKKLNKEGVTVTLVHSGKHKVDGNPFEELSDEVRERIQDRIDTTRQMFAQLVASNRDMSEEAVLATEAQTYAGAEAVAAGLADKTMSFNEVIETMSKKDTLQGATDGSNVGNSFAESETPEQTAGGVGINTGVESEHADVALAPLAFDAGALAELCSAADADHLVSSFIRSKASNEGVSASLEKLQELRGKLLAAEFTPEQIARVEMNFESPAELAAAVVAEMVAEDAEIRNTITPTGGDQSKQLDEDTKLLYSYQTNSTNGDK